jgi:hypothetical protein
MKANDAEALGRTVTENAVFMPPNETDCVLACVLRGTGLSSSRV